MITLVQLKARITRLEDLTAKLGKEVVRCKAGGRLLAPPELRAYLRCIQDTAWRPWTLPA